MGAGRSLVRAECDAWRGWAGSPGPSRAPSALGYPPASFQRAVRHLRVGTASPLVDGVTSPLDHHGGPVRSTAADRAIVRAPMLVRLAFVVSAMASALVLLVVPAAAHSQLQAAEPFDGQVLDVPPTQARLTFNEPIEVPVAGIRIFDSTGERVDDANVVRPAPEVAAVGVGSDLGAGSYIVTFRVVSADGHPIKGAYVFSVGAEAGVDDSVFASVFSADADRPFAVLGALLRFASYAIAFVLAGGYAYARWVEPVDGGVVAPAKRLAWAGVALAVLGIPVQAALETGFGISAAWNGSALGAVVVSPFGQASILRAGALAVVGGLAASPGVGLAASMAAVLSFVLEGHTRTTSPAWLMIPADVVHLAAGAIWTGGLLLLLRSIRAARTDDDPVAAARATATFSGIATWSLVAVAVAGSAMSWVEVRAPRALTSTDYGWTLVAKLVVVGAIIALGTYNNRRLVPNTVAAVAAARRRRATPENGGTDEPAEELPREGERPTAPPWGVLRRTIRLEAIGIVLVLLVTAVLVNLQPAAQEAGITGAFSTYQPLGDDGMEINVVVDPNRVGVNQVHLYVLDASGRPIRDVDVLLRLSQVERDIGPIERTPEDAGPGHWVLIGPELSVPGEWTIEVVAGIDRFTEERASVNVTVNQ